MKKIFLILPVLALLGSCSSSSIPPKDTASSNEEGLSENKSSSKDDFEDETLVVYFSATGNTEKVAKKIASLTNAKTFSLEPLNPYTSEDLDYTNSQSRVSKERLSEKREVPLKEKTPENFENFKTFYLGYPIWWGEASWVTYEFLTSNSFGGKTIIPFATSASSSFGNSDKKLKELAPDANWKEGKRFSGSASQEEISSWISSLK